MKKSILILFLLFCGYCSIAQTAIGEWRDHNSYSTVYRVSAEGSRVYAASKSAMFFYDLGDYATTTLTKVKGLSDVGIATFAYDKAHDCLMIAYTNSNIDIVSKGKVYNIPDVRRSSISGDKKIYSIKYNGDRAYLACGFGIVVVNLETREIEDTYYLGDNGDYAPVFDVAFSDSLIIAGTESSYMTAPKNSRRLHIIDTWTRDTLSPMKDMVVKTLGVNRNWIVAIAYTDNPDSVTSYFQSANGHWGSWGSGHIVSLKSHNGRIVLSRWNRVEVYSENYQLVDTVGTLDAYGAMQAWDADFGADSTLWIGHGWAGVMQVPYKSSTAYNFYPQGPNNNDNVYSITAAGDKVYVCPGGKKSTYANTYLAGNICTFADEEWTGLNRGNVHNNFHDVINVAVDPDDDDHIMATAWGCGVLSVRNGRLEEFFTATNTNNMLSPYETSEFSSLRVGGIAYDADGDLWITNSLSNKGLVVRRANGAWENFETSTLTQGNEIDKIICDTVTGYKWFAGKANRIYVHDGVDRKAYVNMNNGSKLETNAVNCMIQDMSGDIWVGTDKGIKVIYDGYKAFNNGGNGEQSPVTCSNILFSDDGIVEYLMAYENVTCMAVDGANRKWVGTAANGIYLISDNGLEQLEHFTAANSPLASDKVIAVAVQGKNGEVFIGTDKGVQSYRGTATEALVEPVKSKIHAFPNPVRPEYDGPIAIKGFTRNALVHVTDARGHVVYSTQAFGGQAIWNGRTQSGERVASGAYFVFASDEQGKMRSVTKVLVVR